MQQKCKTVEEQYDAAKKCWTILGKGSLRKCYSKNGDDPIEVFRVGFGAGRTMRMVCVCVCVCARACVRACVSACVCVCV